MNHRCFHCDLVDSMKAYQVEHPDAPPGYILECVMLLASQLTDAMVASGQAKVVNIEDWHGGTERRH